MNDPWLVTVRREGGGVDEPEVRRALGLMVAPDGCAQIQALPSARWRHVPTGDTDGLVRAVREFAGDTEVGVYVSLNPFPRPLDRAVRNADVTARRWLLVDPDAVKPGGVKQSTTDAEKEASRVVTEAVRDHLRALGWPVPIFVDSGNNWQLLYRVDLPNDKLSQQLMAQCLKNLGARFDTPRVTIDRAVHDARRICKVPGTWVRKGPNAPDRPWRMARLMSVPMVLTPVPAALLQELAAAKVGTTPPPVGPEPEPPPARAREPGDDDGPVPDPDPAAALEAVRRSFAADPWLAKVTDRPGGEAYARAALGSACAAVASCTHNRNTLLYTESLKIATLCAAGYLDEAEARQMLVRAGTAAGLGRDGDPQEIGRAVANGFAYGLQHPRAVPELRGGKGKAEKPAEPPPLPKGKLIVWANTITPKKVEWLWPQRIPVGKMTTFAGQTSIGKTFVLCDIAARVSTGAEWPFCGGECATPGKSLIISAEDDADDTLVPRLIQLGADLSRIAFLSPEAEERFTMSALELLSSVLEEMGDDVRFVAIDPPTSYMAGVDDHKNVELRGILGPIKRWCARKKVAFLMNTHVNKGGPNVEALMRVMGSAAWVQAVRTASMFAPDPDDPSQARTLFLSLKTNIGKKPRGLAYRIEPVGNDLAKLVWIEEVDTTADDALNKEKKKPGSGNAADWIIDMFSRRREWPSDLWWKELRSGGVTEYSLNQLKGPLQIPKARRVAQPNGDVTWVWFVPPNWPYLNAGKKENHGVEELDDKPF